MVEKTVDGCLFNLGKIALVTFVNKWFYLQEGSSPEIPSLERKNKRRKIKGKKGKWISYICASSIGVINT